MSDTQTPYTGPQPAPPAGRVAASVVTQDANHRFVTDAEKGTFVSRNPLTNTVAVGDLPPLGLAVPFLKVTTDEATVVFDEHDFRDTALRLGFTIDVMGVDTALYPDNTNPSTSGFSIPNEWNGFNLSFATVPVDAAIENFRWVMVSKPAGSSVAFAGGSPDFNINRTTYLTDMDVEGTYIVRTQFTVGTKPVEGNALIITKLAAAPPLVLTINDVGGVAHTTDFTMVGGDNVDVHVTVTPANATVPDLKIICVPPTGITTGFFQGVGGNLLENATDGNFAGISAGVWAFNVEGTVNGVAFVAPLINVTRLAQAS